MFQWHNPSGRAMALGSTQPLTEMSNRETSWGIKAAGAYGWQPYHLHVPIVLKSGRFNILEPSGPVQVCKGIALSFAWDMTWKWVLKIHNLSFYCTNCRLVTKCYVNYACTELEWELSCAHKRAQVSYKTVIKTAQSQRSLRLPNHNDRWDCPIATKIEMTRDFGFRKSPNIRYYEKCILRLFNCHTSTYRRKEGQSCLNRSTAGMRTRP
jgi:hypothetical protein